MSWWEGLVLGIVQGLSEFLPISSSGHLLLLEKLGLGQENLFFNIMLHVGTLFAVLIYLRKDVKECLLHPFSKNNLYLLMCLIPTVALALIFKFVFPDLLGSKFLPLNFMITAFLLIASKYLVFAKPKVNNVKTSILTGIMQGIAVLPGISRSGATVTTQMFLGIEKKQAASFSFLVSIPVILGSALVEIVSLSKDNNGAFYVKNFENFFLGSLGDVEILPLLLGMVFSFISGLLAIKFFMKTIESKGFTFFALYMIIISALSIYLLYFM